MSTSIASKPTFIPAAERFGVEQRVPYDPDRHSILTAHDDMSTPHLTVFERVVGTTDADGRRIAAIVPHKMPSSSPGHIAFVIHSRMFDPDALDFEVGYLLTGKSPAAIQLSEERVLTALDLPAVEMMATLVHAGRLSDIHRSYGLLGTWVEPQWQIVGQGRQILLQLPQPSQDDAVLELQLPVSKTGTSHVQHEM
jgi:hypothetical protein